MGDQCRLNLDDSACRECGERVCIARDRPEPTNWSRTPPRMVRNPSKSGHAPRRTILDQCVGSGRSRAVWISRLHVLHASLYVLGQILSPTISRDLPRSPAISHFEISGRSREIEPAISPTCDVIHQKLRLSANFLKNIACRGRRGSGREFCSFAPFAIARFGWGRPPS